MSSYQPLKPDFSNVVAFVDGLFAKGVRDTSKVVEAARAGRLSYSFADTASRKLILESWLNAWKLAEKDISSSPGPIRPTDQKLITFLADYIRTNQVDLCYPALTYASATSKPGSSIAYYRNSGYARKPFRTGGKWNYGSFDEEGEPVSDGGEPTVATYLSMLYFGAHIVVVYSSEDTSGVASFYDRFESTMRGDYSRDPGHSHYGRINFGQGLYYLEINADEPESGPLLAAYLVAHTAKIHTNAFSQLEGWQATFFRQGKFGGKRHAADFEAHEATLWNFSTFGACPYSEKRSATVFLANSKFKLDIDRITHMPLYRGAGSYQSWMNPGLITKGRMNGAVCDPNSGTTDAVDGYGLRSDGDILFFQGTEMIRQHRSKRKADKPVAISSKFPDLASAGFIPFDCAVVNPHKGSKGTYYFFKGEQYVRWDIYEGKVASGPDRIASHLWQGLEGAGFTTLDAAVYDPTHGEQGKYYFFRGEEFVSFDVKADEMDSEPAYPRKIVDGFPGLKKIGFNRIDMAVSYPNVVHLGGDHAVTVWLLYFFAGDEFAAFDPGRWDTVSRGVYPLPAYDPVSWPGLWW